MFAGIQLHMLVAGLLTRPLPKRRRRPNTALAQSGDSEEDPAVRAGEKLARKKQNETARGKGEKEEDEEEEEEVVVVGWWAELLVPMRL